MEKDIRNADAIARKLGLALTRATNARLEAVKEKRRKREEIMERRKAEAMAAKRHRARRELVRLVKRRMRVTPEMIRIQTKPMTNTHCNSERECGGSYR